MSTDQLHPVVRWAKQGARVALPASSRRHVHRWVATAREKAEVWVTSPTAKAMPFRVVPPPQPVTGPWPEPPEVERSGVATQNIYDTGDRPARFDVELLQKLNEEYRDKPLVPVAPSYDPKKISEQARLRVEGLHKWLNLQNQTVLEFGCGNGYVSWYLGNKLGCEAHGVDVVERFPWASLKGPNVNYHCVDMTQSIPFEDNKFDRVVSFAVLEHVVHPFAALQAIHKVMKPGGLAYLVGNLHRGPKASHLYRDIFFPWPHLLFSDDVIEDWYLSQGKKAKRPAWVNRVTWAQYEVYLRKIGFKIRREQFDITPIDEDLYSRFSDELSRYPRFDLERDFFRVVVEKA